MSSSQPTNEPTLRSLGAAVYLPSFLFAVGQGAVLPIVALAAREVGASVALAGVIVALRGIGTMVFDVPAGKLVDRFGERRAMSFGTAIMLVAGAGCIVSPSPLPFAACMFLMGCGWSMWLLARLTYVSDVMPLGLRGRALSTLGGVNRIGNFVGPFLGAGAITAVGVDGAYYVLLVIGFAGWVVLMAVPEPHATSSDGDHGPTPVAAILREHASVFLTAGLGVMALSVLRASRHALLPLWADHVGIEAAAVGVIFGIASGIDMTLFYPAGATSDRFGRKWIAVPCLTTLAVVFLLVPATSTFWALVALGVLMGLGNGMGSGIVMTLGADFAPASGRASFLGVWRMVSDVGQAGGPFVVAGVTAVASLASAALAIGVLGLAGAAIMLFRVPEPLHRSHPSPAEPS